MLKKKKKKKRQKESARVEKLKEIRKRLILRSNKFNVRDDERKRKKKGV